MILNQRAFSLYYLFLSLVCLGPGGGDAFQSFPPNFRTTPHANLVPLNPFRMNTNPDTHTMTDRVQLFYQSERNDSGSSNSNRERNVSTERLVERKVNSVLRASHTSFQYVESMTDGLLNRHPIIALAIFVGAGALVAYVTGLVFLGGYIENWNPAVNDSVPYWDEEILIISRKVGY